MEGLDPKSHQSTVPTRVCRSLFWALVDARGRSNTPPPCVAPKNISMLASFFVEILDPHWPPSSMGTHKVGIFVSTLPGNKKRAREHNTQNACLFQTDNQSSSVVFGGASLVWKRQIVPFPESSGPNTIWKGILAELSTLPRPKQEKLHSPAESFKPTFP